MLHRRLWLAAGYPGIAAPPLAFSGPYDPAAGHAVTVLTQLHCHTTQSDGSHTPEQIVADYLGTGYGALAITDHDKLTVQPSGVTSKITANELSPSAQHIIAINASYLRGTVSNAQTLIDAVAAAGGYTHVAHPMWSTGMTYAEMAGLTGYMGLEIHNTHCVSGLGQNPVTYPNYAISRWDALLTDNRRDIWGFSTDDLHTVGSFETYDVGRVRVFVPSNTVADVVSGLVAGNFVADVSNHGVTPGYPEFDGADIGVTCAGATRIEAVGNGGALLASSEGESLAYTADGSERYIRLVAVGDFTEPFDSLSDRWRAIDGTWTATGGKLELDLTGSVRRIVLRKHRAGDFTATFDVTPGSTGDYVGLMFNLLSTNYYYLVRLGPSVVAEYTNRLTIAKTTTNSFSAAGLLASTAYTISVGTTYRVALDYAAATGTMRAKVWRPGTDAEPDWMVTGTDATWGHGAFGFRAVGAPQFDNLYVDGFRTYYQPVSVDAA